MEEKRYASIIYGLKLKYKHYCRELCEMQRSRLKKQEHAIKDMIQALIDDYEA